MLLGKRPKILCASFITLHYIVSCYMAIFFFSNVQETSIYFLGKSKKNKKKSHFFCWKSWLFQCNNYKHLWIYLFVMSFLFVFTCKIIILLSFNIIENTSCDGEIKVINLDWLSLEQIRMLTMSELTWEHWIACATLYEYILDIGSLLALYPSFKHLGFLSQIHFSTMLFL